MRSDVDHMVDTVLGHLVLDVTWTRRRSLSDPERVGRRGLAGGSITVAILPKFGISWNLLESQKLPTR